jgi:hypothetical protein
MKVTLSHLLFEHVYVSILPTSVTYDGSNMPLYQTIITSTALASRLRMGADLVQGTLDRGDWYALPGR